VTPNLPEAQVLLGREVHDLDQRRAAARELVAMGARAAVVKGGHSGDAIDIFYDGSQLVELSSDRTETPNTHGSGCVFSAAIAAWLARGADPLDAALEAKTFITKAIANSLEIGHGHGPVNPMFGATDRG
jgi:hydroxymethylpyrimidine/phosphomethylpyrimidine kinase